MSVKVQNVELQRGGRALVRGLTFDLDDGDGLVVTGENGIGKTTLLHALAGLVRPASGRVDADGVIALLQDTRADRRLSVGQSASFWADIYDANADETLRYVGLHDRSDQIVDTLSAGQAKRLAFGVLLMARAKIWLLDEPLAALDTRARAWVLSQIGVHLKQGGIVVWATHRDDLPMASTLRRLHMAAS